jgi:hypothetical protein
MPNSSGAGETPSAFIRRTWTTARFNFLVVYQLCLQISNLPFYFYVNLSKSSKTLEKSIEIVNLFDSAFKMMHNIGINSNKCLLFERFSKDKLFRCEFSRQMPLTKLYNHITGGCFQLAQLLFQRLNFLRESFWEQYILSIHIFNGILK